MIPVFVVPVLDRYDLLSNMEASVDEEVFRYYIVDNGGGYDDGDGGRWHDWWNHRHVCRPGFNLGFGASVNLAIRANLHAPWWFFSNDDMVYARGDLAKVSALMESVASPLVAVLDNCGFSAFAVNDKAIEMVGWFDEAYYPAYCEDTDWAWRAGLAEVSFVTIPGTSRHLGSQTINGATARRTANDRTYPLNKAYHLRKWGGNEPRQEVYATPFNEGGDPFATTAPKLSRLRELAW